MSVEVACPNCTKRLRAPEKQLGKKVKCPHCKQPFALGSTEQGEQWNVQIADGQQFGPVSRAELDTWMAEGRLNAECQVLQEGWDQWQWADQVFPQLAAAAGGGVAPGPGPIPAVGGAAVGVPAPEANAFDFAAGSGSSSNIHANPYTSPSVGASESQGSGKDDGKISKGVRLALARTSPWVLFLAILGFIFCGLGTMGVLMNLVMSMASGSGSLMAMVMLMGMVQLAIMGGLYFLPSLLMFKYSKAINVYLRNETTRNLERALDAQRKFWHTLGIIVIILLSIIPISIIFMMMMGAAIFSSFR